MMKKRGLLLVILSLLIAAAAAAVANNYVKNRLASAGARPVTVTVLAAAMRIPYGTKLEARHVKTLDVPESVLPPGAIRKFEDIEGHITKSDILEGEIVLQDRVAGGTAGSTLAALVAPDKRAVSVRVNDVIGVAGFLLPGNYVDVLGTRLENGASRRAVTETIIHMVKVLAVDQTASTDKNEPVVVHAVTLELSPKEAEALVKWAEEGTIQLALRNPNDKKMAEPEPEPAPKPVRAARHAVPKPEVVDEGVSVTLIRGMRVEQQKSKG